MLLCDPCNSAQLTGSYLGNPIFNQKVQDSEGSCSGFQIGQKLGVL